MNLYRDHRKKTPDGAFFLWSTKLDASQTHELLESLYAVLSNYDLIYRRVSRLQLILQDIVKPESLETTKFLM